jgi:hypothetical protein
MQRVEVLGDMNGFVSLTLYIRGNNKSIFNVAVEIETGVTVSLRSERKTNIDKICFKHRDALKYK